MIIARMNFLHLCLFIVIYMKNNKENKLEKDFLLSIVMDTKFEIDRKRILTPLQLGDCVKDIIRSKLEEDESISGDNEKIERYAKDAYKLYFTPSTFGIVKN